MDRIIISISIILVLFGSNFVNAQEQKSLPETDRLTYVLFQQKNWDGLISEGRKALKSGIDYYYLRVRLGLAYYEKQNFHLAARHFEKALKMNDSEAYVGEYLYYSYLMAGRQAEASLLAAGFSLELKRKTKTEKRNFISGLDLAYNYTGITETGVLDNFTTNIPLDKDGTQFIPKQHHYFFLGLQHQISSRWSFYHGYSNLQVNQLRYTQASNESKLENDFQSELHQYYSQMSFLVTKGLTLSGGLHYVNSKYQTLTEVLTGSPGRPFVRKVATTVNNNNWVGFVSVYKRFEYISLGASYYRGNISDFIQNQTDFKLITYPLGNLHLYTITTASFQNQDFIDGSNNNRLVIDQQLGLKATEWLWLEAYGTFGEIENYFMKDGLVIFNRMDLVKQRFGGRLIFQATPKWSFTVDYTYLKNQSQFIQTPLTGETFNQKNYQLHSLTAITSWRF
ncbi:hypothetical protein [Cyclobacterium sp. SYSU L10401]|uniref:hypothetical protein n=1 Tax=Cyclobacterium sp. SYSU L10401 TaxID=2678657 RepID=UPI0013D4922A|nr:hypothetical protein [Cyclobacterium sp. SYSU L10401]